MTVREFENGYWYLHELKDFGRQIGILGATNLRKDELERSIVAFLRTGKVKAECIRGCQSAVVC